MLKRPNYISPSSLKKWIKDKSARAWHYLMWVKNDNTYTAMEVWSAVHKAIESYNKWWELVDQINSMEDYLVSIRNDGKITSEEYKELWDISQIAFDNFINAWYERVKSEVPATADVWLPFPLYAIADWLPTNEVWDYKVVGKYTNPDEQPNDYNPVTTYMTYKIQALMNVMILKSKEIPVSVVRFIEILKDDGTPPSTITKDELIALCKNKHGEDISLVDENGKQLTKEGLIAKYDPKTDTVREIIFEVTDEWLSEWYDYLNQHITDIDKLCNDKWAK